MRTADASAFVLDTSAIMTLFEKEDGFLRVRQVIQQNQVFLPWTVLLETTYITRQQQGQTVAEERYAALRRLFTDILWEMDEATLLTASRWKADYRLSFADAIIAAYTRSRKAVLLHKDPEFEALRGKVALEALPYKL